MHDPELLIRTGGERRLSNYLLWQVAESELVFTDELWPDFSRADLEAAIRQFRERAEAAGDGRWLGSVSASKRPERAGSLSRAADVCSTRAVRTGNEHNTAEAGITSCGAAQRSAPCRSLRH